tara:strand:- start:4413 stop:5441 length:1029 start_codon:yes stop_codon:yes gene_type:complete
MALPLLLGLGGSALGAAGMLGGLGALGAGAIGSGLGSLAQGDDLGTAISTGMMSYFGGKALGGLFGGAGGAAGAQGAAVAPSASDLAVGAGQGAQGLGSGIPLDPGMMAGNTGASVASEAAKSSILSDPTVGMTFKESLPYAGSASGLGALAAPKFPEIKKKEYPDIPENLGEKRDMKSPLSDFRPGLDPEFRYFAEGGEVQRPNDKQIIGDAVDAIQGTHPDPKGALGLFVATYGDDALRDLVARVRSGEFEENSGVTEGMVEGVGDGMDDMIPATLEGEQDVVLSDGEFIVPADVVSGLGNGSTDAGAESLYDMMDRVREMRTGMAEQPDQVPQGMMLPA